MDDLNKEDRILIASVANAIAKISLYVTICIVAGMLFTNCKVDSEIIVQCEDACGTDQGIKEVTAWSCTCNNIIETLESNWVLPK